ncbi:MAG: sigma factor-like helix-turn-helix DNA-binding protein [Ignavibacteriota bacterium]
MALSGEVRERLTAAMGDLSATERSAFVLRHFEGMCIEDVSRVLGCQPGAAKHSVFRAVQKCTAGVGARSECGQIMSHLTEEELILHY